jgi:hypothetical protein
LEKEDLQFIDLMQVSDALSGFSGMFVHENELKNSCEQDKVFYTIQEYFRCSPKCNPIDGHPGKNRYIPGRYGKKDKSCD